MPTTVEKIYDNVDAYDDDSTYDGIYTDFHLNLRVEPTQRTLGFSVKTV